VKYAWIHQHRDSFPVALMCQVLRVSKSGYYDSIERQPGPRAVRHARIQTAVRQVHAASHGIYGSGKIANALLAEADVVFIMGSRTGQICYSDWTLPRPGATVGRCRFPPATSATCGRRCWIGRAILTLIHSIWSAIC